MNDRQLAYFINMSQPEMGLTLRLTVCKVEPPESITGEIVFTEEEGGLFVGGEQDENKNNRD